MFSDRDVLKLTVLVGLFISVLREPVSAQSLYQPYSFEFYQKLNKYIYDKGTHFHSSLKPIFINDSLVVAAADSILSYGVDTSRKGFIQRKLFQEHLIDIQKEDYTAFLDFLPDFIVGGADGKSTWLNTRGYQIGGTIGKNFYFYTSGYENQSKLPGYYDQYVNTTKVVPGQSYDRSFGQTTKDWSYVTALISYTPIKYLNITIGQDKNFIGDGYRSMLLSDYTSNYPFLKLTANLGNVQYMAMWAAFQEPNARKVNNSYDVGNRKKGGVFHYLDWNVSKRLSLGFFDAIVWSQYDDNGNKRGFDWGYANPIVFLRPVEAFSGSPDNAVLGLTGKYEVLNKHAIYGQFMLDEFQAKEFFSKSGSNRNKWGAQIGLRGADLFKVSRLNYLLEHNWARPYTYSSRTSMLSYSHYSEPLAHPFGGNFKETVGILAYSWRRFDFQSKLTLAKYGLDQDVTTNYGKDVFRPYPQATITEGTKIGQGLETNLSFLDTRISFMLNPKYNLRFELGSILRNEKNSKTESNTSWLTFGLRSSFRNLYQDF